MNKKIEATLNCIKDSETILSGEYYIIHSDFIIALEEEIKELQHTILRIVDERDTYKYKIEQLENDLDCVNSNVSMYAKRQLKALNFIESTKCYGFRGGKTILGEYLKELSDIIGGKDNESN